MYWTDPMMMPFPVSGRADQSHAEVRDLQDRASAHHGVGQGFPETVAGVPFREVGEQDVGGPDVPVDDAAAVGSLQAAGGA